MSTYPDKLPLPRTPFLHPECGFSLPELLIAIVIFSVGMLAVGTMLTSSLENDRYNMSRRSAENLASDIAEEFKARNPDGLLSEGTKRYIFYDHNPADEDTGFDELSAILYDWEIRKCAGCSDKTVECVGLTDGFTCPGAAELTDTRQVEIWVGWGPIYTATGLDPMGECADLSTAKCRKRRVMVRTYVKKP